MPSKAAAGAAASQCRADAVEQRLSLVSDTLRRAIFRTSSQVYTVPDNVIPSTVVANGEQISYLLATIQDCRQNIDCGRSLILRYPAALSEECLEAAIRCLWYWDRSCGSTKPVLMSQSLQLALAALLPSFLIFRI